MEKFNGAKVFSATKAKEREELGDRVTDWIYRHSEMEIVDYVVKQSSDNEFHCLSIIIFYKNQKRE